MSILQREHANCANYLAMIVCENVKTPASFLIGGFNIVQVGVGSLRIRL